MESSKSMVEFTLYALNSFVASLPKYSLSPTHVTLTVWGPLNKPGAVYVALPSVIVTFSEVIVSSMMKVTLP